MKNKTLYRFIFITVIAICSCNNQQKEQKIQANNEPSQEAEVPTVADSTINTEHLDKKRYEIEAAEIKAIEVSTSALREKIKQKWSKIHFYVQNYILVKVKTYPHENISKRTEEFYADANGLFLAVVEDKGDFDKKDENMNIDKKYYYQNDKLVREIKNDEENEYSIKESEAAELLAEFKEYVEILKINK